MLMHLFLRVLLLLGPAFAVVVTAPGTVQVAVADDDDDDDEDDDDDDEDDEDDEDEDEDAGDYEQPPVTAGGLYTKKTYPIAEIDRPLTLIGGMFEARAGLNIDMSANTAFEGGRLEARYGLRDNIELQAAADFLLGGEVSANAANAYEARLAAGFETAIVYDLVDFRGAVEVPIANGDAAVDIAFGFPFRYRLKPNIAIIALDKVMTIHTDSDVEGNTRKPDLTLGLGAIYQVVDKLALIGRAEVTIPEFNTDIGPVIPATAAAQLSPNNRVDLGLEFTLGDLEADEPFASRFLLLYLQVRP